MTSAPCIFFLILLLGGFAFVSPMLGLVAAGIVLAIALGTAISRQRAAQEWFERRKIRNRWKSRGLKSNEIELWKEWNKRNVIGRDAYYRGAYAEATQRFKELLNIASRLSFPSLGRLPQSVEESSRWWQAEIIRQGVRDWNAWRQANPQVTPDLRGQDLSLENTPLPYSSDDHWQERGMWTRDLSGANLAGADLRGVCLYFSNLGGINFRGANLEHANLCDCDLRGADFRGANLSLANLQDSDLSGANLTDTVGLTEGHVYLASGDLNTALPAGIERPQTWDRAGRHESST